MTPPPLPSTALVLLRIDDFESVVADHGDESARELLGRVAHTLRADLRAGDVVAVHEDDAIVVVLPAARRLDGLIVADRLRSVVASRTRLGARRVTLSAGIAATPEDGPTVDAITPLADEAARWARAHGENLSVMSGTVSRTDEEHDRSDVLAHLHAVVAAIDARELFTRDHSDHVATYATAIGRELGLPEQRLLQLRDAAFLHDIGKIAVDDLILAKPGRLTDDEFEQVAVHPGIGSRMLHHAGLEDEAMWIRHHHERMDGAGYPDGLVGDEIALEARIIFAADALEAMTSDRPYRRGVPVHDAVAELRRCAGTQFDRGVVDVLVSLLDRGRLSVNALRGAAQAPAS